MHERSLGTPLASGGSSLSSLKKDQESFFNSFASLLMPQAEQFRLHLAEFQDAMTLDESERPVLSQQESNP